MSVCVYTHTQNKHLEENLCSTVGCHICMYVCIGSTVEDSDEVLGHIGEHRSCGHDVVGDGGIPACVFVRVHVCMYEHIAPSLKEMSSSCEGEPKGTYPD